MFCFSLQGLFGMKTRLFDQPNFYYVLFAVLLIPALLINLGVHHMFIHTDESRRALVALEMILSDQYIAPTLNGEFYYNKPPLYNWIMALSFKLFGSYSNFAVRFPVVVAIIAFGIAIYRFIAPVKGKAFAWLVIIATITSGRILFYDSFLGLIDVAFSVLIFINFMLFYTLGRQGASLKLFAVSYFLMAVAYLMKGLPPVVFQFFTLVAWAVFMRDWKLLFHRTHFLGVLFFILPVGLYYYFYLQINPGSAENLFTTVFSESSKRTVTDHSWLDNLKAIFLFPLENMYHFAPWTLLVFILFAKGTWRKLWADDFSRFAILVFGLNILVYWTSPGVHPRYLFMFLPLFFAVLFQAMSQAGGRFERVLQRVVFVVMLLVLATPAVAMIYANDAGISAFQIKLIVTFAGMLLICALYLRRPAFRWLILGIFLLVLRIGFDWVMLPNRDARGRGYQADAEKVASVVGDEPVYLLGPNYTHDATSFVISRARDQILSVSDSAKADTFYIVHESYFNPEMHQDYLKFRTKSDDYFLFLIKLK